MALLNWSLSRGSIFLPYKFATSKITINTQATMCVGVKDNFDFGANFHRTFTECFQTFSNFFRHITHSILGWLDGTGRSKSRPPANPPIMGRGQPGREPWTSSPQSPEVLVLRYKALTKEGTPVLGNCKENPRGNIVSAAGLITNVSKSGIGIVWGLI